MTPAEVTTILRQFNGWRRDFDDKFEQPDPHEVSEAIDAAVEMIERLEAAEKSDAESLTMYRKARDERDALRAALRHEADCVEAAKAEIEALRAKIEAMEKQEPYSYIYEYANPIDGSPVWRDVPGYWNAQYPRSSKPLYAFPGAQNVPKAVAYLDLGTGGYMDIGTDLTDEALAALPKGRHMLGIVGTYGVEGYVQAQPAPFIPEGWKLVPIEVIELYSFMCAAFVPMTPQQEQIALQLDLAKRAMLAVAPEAKL